MGFPVVVGLNYGQEKEVGTNSRGRALGTRGVTGDGRVFYWAKNGATEINAHRLVATSVYQSNITESMDLDIGTNVSGVTSLTVKFTCPPAANEYADGTLTFGVSPGYGTYKVKSHVVGVSTTKTAVTLYEDDKLRQALTSGTTKVGLHRNPYASVIINPAAPTGAAIGVTPVVVPIANYFWLQTWGRGGVIADTSPVVGERLTVSSVSAGGVIAATTGGVDVARTTIGFSSDTGGGADAISEITITIAP